MNLDKNQQESNQEAEEEEKSLLSSLEKLDNDQFSQNSNDIDIFTSFFETKKEQEELNAQERRKRRQARLKQLQLSIEEDKEGKDDSNYLGKRKEKDREEKLGDDNNKRQKVRMDTTDNNSTSRNDDYPTTHTQKQDNSNQQSIEQNENNNYNLDSGNDSFDMFASTSPLSISPHHQQQQHHHKLITNIQQQESANDKQNYNDSEGYYKATIGEIISFPLTYHNDRKKDIRLKVLGIVGKGVFSTVLKCTSLVEQSDNNSNNHETVTKEHIVAMKLIRSNDVMTKAAEKEVKILRMLRQSSSDHQRKGNANHFHFIVRMLELEDFHNDGSEIHQSMTNDNNNKDRNDIDNAFFKQRPILEYRNHTVLLFDYMPNNLREVLSKFGKNVGINLSSVKSYAKQLVLALKHLSVHGIIHADIKLDNILVTSDWTTIKLCDFGSAILESDEEYINHIPTPYLVSRFYRAPEIILGLPFNKMIDLWSVAVSLAELFTGNVFFPGRTNNDMIKLFMESIGPFSNKMVRRHISAFTKIGSQPHFEAHAGGGGNFDFRRQDYDKITGKPIIRISSASQDHNVIVPSKQISQVILRSRSGSDSRGDVIKFSDFLTRCLTLDPVKRICLDDALKHSFLVH